MAASTDHQNHPPNCLDDPNFATICSFLENFGETCHIGFIPFNRLQAMLEDSTEVAQDLAQIHILLLRRIYKSINTEKWEKHLTKFCHSYNSQDAWEVERFGYKKAKIQTKLRLLKNLMESQFDYNIKFKNEVNKLTADTLRRMPLGTDSEGQLYWYQVDAEANLRIYREDVDDDTWELVATSKEEMTELIQQLTNGIVQKNSVEVEGENGGGEGEASPKEDDILLDTGTVSEKGSDESSSDDDGMAIDEDAASAGEEEEDMEVDLKESEVDKMNTTELGKTVRQMLDNSSSVAETKMPEIKQEAQGASEESVATKVEEVHSDTGKFELSQIVSVSDSIEPGVEETVQDPPSSILPIQEEIQEKKLENEQTLETEDCKGDLQFSASVAAESQPVTMRSVVDVEEEVPKALLQDTSNHEELVAKIQADVPLTSATESEISELIPSDKAQIHETSMGMEVDLANSPSETPAPECPLPVLEDPPTEKKTEASQGISVESVSSNEVPVLEPPPTPSRPTEHLEISTALTTETQSSLSVSDVAPLDATLEPSSFDKSEVEIPVLETSQSEPSVVFVPESELEAAEQSISDADQSDPTTSSPSFERSASEVEVSVVEQGERSDFLESGMEASQSISDAPQFDEHFVSESSGEEASEGQAQVSLLEESQNETPDLLPAASVAEISESLPAAEVTDEEIPRVSFEKVPEVRSSESNTAELPTEWINAENNLETVEPSEIFSPIASEQITSTDRLTATSDVSTELESENSKKISEDLKSEESEQDSSTPEQEMTAELITENLIDVSQEAETFPAQGRQIEIRKVQTEIEEPGQKSELIESPSSCLESVTEPAQAIQEDLIQQPSPVSDNVVSNSRSVHELYEKTQEPLGVVELGNLEVPQVPGTTEPMELTQVEEPEVDIKEEIPCLEGSEEGITKEGVKSEEESACAHTKVNSTPVESPIVEVSQEIPEPIPVVEEVTQKSTAWVVGASDLETSISILMSSNNEAPVQGLMEELQVPSPPAQLPQQEQTPPSPECPANVPNPIEEEAPVKPLTSGLLGLVGYADTSEEEDEEGPTRNSIPPVSHSVTTSEPSKITSEPSEPIAVSGKRRAESPGLENPSKCSKMDKSPEANADFNPIVGEAIEEEMILIVGEGSGAELEGGNSPIAVSLNNTAESVEEEESSTDESPKKGPGRPRGRKPGSGRAGHPSKRGGGSGGRKGKQRSPERDESSNASATSTPASIKKRVNGRLSTEIPTRQSSRIAKIQEKEEVERRRLEEERLVQLKAAQLKKQERQVEREQKQQSKESGEGEGTSQSKPRGKGRPPKSESKYLPTPSATDSEDEDLQTAIKKSKKRGRKRKHGEPPRTLMKKGLNPWIHSSSEDEDEAVEEEEEHDDMHEEVEEDMTMHSDHEFSPESDMGEDDDASPSRHARTVKRGETKEDKYAETNCGKCGKGDHPEWILLCDSCDVGWHASCLRPVTWVIPEGSWFCPPCQHKMLIEKLNENLEEYDKIVKKHELEVLRKQRLAFVGISLDNVLPEGEGEKGTKEKKKKRRRQISSDEDEDELMAGGQGDHFIDEREDSSNLSKYNSEESEDEPMYKLRARKATKSFDFKEYDDMINSALRDEDEYEVGETGEGGVAEVPAKAQENGDAEETEPPPPKLVVSKGKVMPGTSDGEEEEELEEKASDSSDVEEVDEVEKKRRQELEKQSHRKTRRRLNDLDATSDEDSDENFKVSEDEDEEEDETFAAEDSDSEWSGDRDGEESDDSIAKKGKKGKLGRQEKYLDVGSVRRSSRKARSRIVYDESDQEDASDEPAGGWGSENESGASTASESEDETWGKKKKKKKVAYNPPSKLRKSDFLFNSGPSKSKSKASPKKKKKKVDEDETDRAWSKHGGKVKKGDTESSNKRSTRGKQIDFKVILDSGESDDDGNIHPKRVRPVVPDYENDAEEPSSSKQLVAELNAAQAADKAKGSKRKNSKPNNRKPSAASPPRKPATSASPSKSPAKKKVKVKNVLSSSEDSAPETEPTSKLAEQLLKPIPAPPIPPNLAKRLSTPAVLPPGIPVPPLPHPPQDSRSNTPPPVSSPSPVIAAAAVTQAPLTAVSQPSTNLMMSEILASSGSKKQQSSPQQQPVPRHPTPPPSSPGVPPQIPNSPGPRPQLAPPPSSGIPGGGGGPMMFPAGKVTPPHRGLSSPPHQAHTLLPPSEISRLPNPAYYPPNPGMRFPWDRNLGLPPYQGRGPPPQSMVKSPPHNNSPYPPGGPPPRSGYIPPPPLRIPNPGGSGPPLQSFQQFKREPPGPGPQMMYRMPPQGNGGGRGIPPPNILAHLQSSHERFFASGGFGGPPPYGIPPPGPLYSTTQPQQFDYRHEDSEFKEEVSHQPERRPSPPPPAASKEENKSDGEFGGLVSYFSSQRGEEDMDT